MTRQEKAVKIMEILDKIYPKTPIPLKHKQNNVFTFLVAVLLSARATDKMVNKITPALFKLADTPEKMMKVPTEKIRAIIKPIGLSPAKSKNIKALSKILVEKFDGKVPDSFSALESLPGVGHKTASVIMSQAFNQPAFPIDTHGPPMGPEQRKIRDPDGTRSEKNLPEGKMEQTASANDLFRP